MFCHWVKLLIILLHKIFIYLKKEEKRKSTQEKIAYDKSLVMKNSVFFYNFLFTNLKKNGKKREKLKRK